MKNTKSPLLLLIFALLSITFKVYAQGSEVPIIEKVLLAVLRQEPALFPYFTEADIARVSDPEIQRKMRKRGSEKEVHEYLREWYEKKSFNIYDPEMESMLKEIRRLGKDPELVSEVCAILFNGGNGLLWIIKYDATWYYAGGF